MWRYPFLTISNEKGKTKTEEAPPVFGVPLSVSVERCRCHDGIKIPVVVRECIDFIEENGLKVEGIYRYVYIYLLFLHIPFIKTYPIILVYITENNNRSVVRTKSSIRNSATKYSSSI